MKVRLYVKAKTRRTIIEWLDTNNIEIDMHNGYLSTYSNYFMLDRSIATQIVREFPQRDLRIVL